MTHFIALHIYRATKDQNLCGRFENAATAKLSRIYRHDLTRAPNYGPPSETAVCVGGGDNSLPYLPAYVQATSIYGWVTEAWRLGHVYTVIGRR